MVLEAVTFSRQVNDRLRKVYEDSNPFDDDGKEEVRTIPDFVRVLEKHGFSLLSEDEINALISGAQKRAGAPINERVGNHTTNN